jgi:hypothetical protein
MTSNDFPAHQEKAAESSGRAKYSAASCQKHPSAPSADLSGRGSAKLQRASSVINGVPQYPIIRS